MVNHLHQRKTKLNNNQHVMVTVSSYLSVYSDSFTKMDNEHLGLINVLLQCLSNAL